MNHTEYYKFSGKFSIGKTIIFSAIGTAIVAVISFLYSLLVALIPFVYLNFLITIGMGVCIMLTLDFVAKKSKIRNTFVRAIIGIIFFLIFVYVHFFSYAALHLPRLIEGVTSDNVFDIISSPKGLFASVRFLNEIGTWGIGSSGNGVVSGLFLSLIWLCEHLIVIFFTCINIKNSDIYIESKNCWAEEKPFETVVAPFPETVRESLEQKDFLPIEQTSLGNPENDHCVISYMTDAEETSGEYYLKLVNIFIKINKKGNKEKEEKTLLEGLKMTGADIKHIGEILNQLNG